MLQRFHWPKKLKTVVFGSASFLWASGFSQSMAACCSLVCRCVEKKSKEKNRKKSLRKRQGSRTMPRGNSSSSQGSQEHRAPMVIRPWCVRWKSETWRVGDSGITWFAYVCLFLLGLYQDSMLLFAAWSLSAELKWVAWMWELYKVSGEKLGVNHQLCFMDLLGKTASCWARSWSLCPVESQLRPKTILTMFLMIPTSPQIHHSTNHRIDKLMLLLRYEGPTHSVAA